MAQAQITYNGINIAIGVRIDSLDVRFRQDRDEMQAGSGITETINRYGIMEVGFTGIFTAAIYRSLIGWWSWARQGKAFAFAVDSSYVASTTLDGAAASGQKVIPLTATTGFAAGHHCLIRAVDNDDEFEIVEIASVSAGISVTAVDNLIFGYAASDIFRHWQYWPSMLDISAEFAPRRLDVTQYYEAEFNFREAL